jgi:hypothetical protein
MSPSTQSALDSVTNYKQLDPTAAASTANTTYDVSGKQSRLSALQGLVGNLQSSVEAVDPSVTGRTSGTFTTEAQRSALVSKERAPILNSLSKEQGVASAAQGDLTQSQSLASQMASSLLSGDKQKYQQLLDTYNTLSAQDKQAEAKAEADRTFQEQQRQFNVSAAQKAASASTTAASSKVSTINSLNSDIASNVADFRSKPAGWTEKVLIPQLIAAYPELTTKQITDNVYNLRKQYE